MKTTHEGPIMVRGKGVGFVSHPDFEEDIVIERNDQLVRNPFPLVPKSDYGTPVPPTLFSAQNIPKALAALRQEPWVSGVRHNPVKHPEWRIEVNGGGTPEFGHAEVACIIISENGAKDDISFVQIVDAATFASTKRYDISSLGTVDCNTSAQLPF